MLLGSKSTKLNLFLNRYVRIHNRILTDLTFLLKGLPGMFLVEIAYYRKTFVLIQILNVYEHTMKYLIAL